jgi:hypothetical protein
MSIANSPVRVGNFTSSNIYKLTVKGKGPHGFGDGAMTYIAEKKMERRLGRSLDVSKQTRPMLWGLFLEPFVHNMLPLSYELVSQESIVHPTIKTWVGSPDNVNRIDSVVGDTKCYEPKAFAEYVDVLTACMNLGSVDLFRKTHKKEYYQLVSNAIILGVDNIEPIAYMPYKSELPVIRALAENFDSPEQYKYRFIAEAPDEELAHLPDGGHYKNLNQFRFKVPQEDIDFLTERVLKATELLEKDTTTLIASPIPEGIMVEAATPLEGALIV